MLKAIVKTTTSVLNLSLLVLFAFLFFMPSIIAETDNKSSVKSLPVECVLEPGSPVVIVSARNELDLDSFGSPTAMRLYVDYKNVSDKNIAAVKFRVRLIDSSGKDRGTFQAPQLAVVNPGASSSEKWRHEKIDPRVSASKMKVLLVKFTDGSIWQSANSGSVVLPASPMLEENSIPAGQE